MAEFTQEQVDDDGYFIECEGEDERGHFVCIWKNGGPDGAICDVYGEDEEDALRWGKRVVEALNCDNFRSSNHG